MLCRNVRGQLWRGPGVLVSRHLQHAGCVRDGMLGLRLGCTATATIAAALRCTALRCAVPCHAVPCRAVPRRAVL